MPYTLSTPTEGRGQGEGWTSKFRRAWRAKKFGHSSPGNASEGARAPDPTHDDRDWLERFINAAFGWLFRPFNRFFDWSANRYSLGVAAVIRKSAVALLLYVGLIGLTFLGFKSVPTGFVPTQDKQYLVAFAQLPDAASLDRTEAVIRRMSDLALKYPGVESAVAFPGLSINGFTVSPNSGIVFVCLKPFAERRGPGGEV